VNLMMILVTVIGLPAFEYDARGLEKSEIDG